MMSEGTGAAEGAEMERRFQPNDLRVDVFENMAEAIVRVTHLPTGISGTGRTGREWGTPASSLAAKEVAVSELMEKLRTSGFTDSY